ncbi:FUSC family protein [Cyanobium sp. Alchichica 3B3-8F6]|uniref:FUSC family protein n=1 Tax=unclassified Cyanobium TaxID=2627006 RepID=UPI0018E928BA|nr:MULTISPECIES: FUSC family protein [unclassified Cyanobium]MCP9881164.1 FUSC family protein [Cyanobium sp. Alchichica 3B3-8F6]MCP9940892.1 FUSC family protein [Cyanobium sp. ATX 6E8]
MQNLLLRNSLKLFVAVFITAAIASWTERIQFLWYPLMAVVIVVDDNDDHTVQAATSRILGTVIGGLITFLVHTMLSGWIGVLVSLLVMIPVLQRLGWQSALGTAGLTAVMFLMIPSHASLNWDYVFNRGLDTVVGCVVAIVVGLLFWPQNSSSELTAADRLLRRLLQAQLQAYSDWLGQRRSRPEPLDPAPLTNALQRMEQLVAQERSGPRHQALKRSGWEQRLRLWQLAHFHWIAWERLLAGLPEQQSLKADPLRHAVGDLQRQLSEEPTPTPPRQPQRWQQLAQQLQLPLLPLLALAEEGRPLHACLGGLNRMAPP